MIVSLFPQINQNKRISSKSFIPNLKYNPKLMTQDTVSFGSGTGLIYLVARSGLEAIKDGPKHYNVVNLLKEVEAVLKKPDTYSNNERADTLSALSKLPDSASDGFWYHLVSAAMGKSDFFTFWSGSDFEVSGLRHSAIELLSKIEDDTSVNIQSKKDFINSLFNLGYDISDKIIEQFRGLHDNHYGSFKQEIINKVLYSKEYHQRWVEREKKSGSEVEGNSYIQDGFIKSKLALINTLDSNFHFIYLAKIQPDIIQLKKVLFKSLITPKIIRGKVCYPIHANFIRSNNTFIGHDSSNLFGYDDYAKVFWTETVKAFNYDHKKIANCLGVEECLIEDMVADTKACEAIAKAGTSNDEKIRICINRINEKFSNSDPRIKMSAYDWIVSAQKSGYNMDKYLQKLNDLYFYDI